MSLSGTTCRDAGGATARSAPGLSARLLRFGAVGIAATLVHTAVGVGLHYQLGVPAFWANVVAFCCALMVSFRGQTRLTFPEAEADRAAFLRFTAVAVGGLGLNQLIVWVVTGLLGAPYWLALGLIFATVPAVTFVALRYWALRR